MRARVAWLLVALSAAPSFAEIPSPQHQEIIKLEARFRSARIQRNVGWALAAVGVVLAAAGTITAVFSAYQSGYDVAGLITGVSLGAAGLALAIPGIILSLRGQDAMTEVAWRLGAALPVTPIVAPAPSRNGSFGGGLLIGTSFRF